MSYQLAYSHEFDVSKCTLKLRAHTLLLFILAACLGCWAAWNVQQFRRQKQAEDALAIEHGCQLPSKLPTRWPLGLDRIKELWDANAEGQLLAFLCSIANDYEPRNNLYQFLLVGPRAFHVLHPENVEALLSTNFNGESLSLICDIQRSMLPDNKDFNLGCRPAVFAPLLGSGIFTQEGPKWKHSRDLLRKQFARAHYQDLCIFHEHVDNLVNRIKSSGLVDLQPLFFDLTLDVTTAFLFGRSVYTLRADIDQDAKNKVFAESFNIAQEGLAKRFRIAPFHNLYKPRSFRQACKNVHKFVDEYIQEHRSSRHEKSESSTSWLMGHVARESVNGNGIRDQMLSVLLAGRDGTACCLSWTLRLLVRHPQTLTRLREEIRHVMKEELNPSRAQIRKMPLLSAVIKESLRLYPPVPLNNRVAVRTTVLPTGGGPDGNSPILVRKGEMVVISQYVTSRRKNIFGNDADDFRPERWETGELTRVGWAYFPFHGGPRQCLGEDFALMEVSFVIVRLLQTFGDIRLPEGETNEPVGKEKQRLTLVLSSADGCKVSITR